MNETTSVNQVVGSDLGTGKNAAPERWKLGGELGRRLAVFAGVFLGASLLSPAFLTSGNLQVVLMAASAMGVLAFGMTVVLIAGEIDLSVGSAAALASVAGGLLVPSGSSFAVIAATMLAGAAIGLVNGIGVTIFRVPSLIVTLAMLSIARALCSIVSSGKAVYPDNLAGYMWIGRGDILGVPAPIVILLAVAVLGVVVTRFLVFGRKLYAVGGNAVAAALSGIGVGWVKLAAFIICGLCASIAGMIESARLAYINPAAFEGYELGAIAVAVLGGASLFGGRGSIEGALIAAVIIAVVNNVLNLLGVSIYLQQVATALIIISVVLPDSFQKERA